MRFFAGFKREKGGASADPALGSDSAPTTVPNAKVDNQMSFRYRDINGFVAQRVAVVLKSSTGSSALNGDLYFWEERTQHWYKSNASTVSIPNGGVAYFDVVSVCEPAPTRANLESDGSPADGGSLDLALVLSDPGAAAAAVYEVALAADTSNPA